MQKLPGYGFHRISLQYLGKERLYNLLLAIFYQQAALKLSIFSDQVACVLAKLREDSGAIMFSAGSTMPCQVQVLAKRSNPGICLPKTELFGGSLLPSQHQTLTRLRRRSSSVVRINAAFTSEKETTTQIPGFVQLAEPVPKGMVLNDVVKTLPREAFEIDNLKAWKTVVITVSALATGYAALAVAPWYLYPFVYAFLGTAATGLFVIGHDCGHNSFSKSQLVNDIVGTMVMTPLIFPFEPWRIKHNTHHAHTNKLIMDTAWQPFRPHQYENAGRVGKFLMRATMGPLWWIASVGHWLFWHFDLTKFRPQERARAQRSIAAVCAFGLLVLVPLLITQGPLGFIKWWFLPWLGFHFWMSTFTLVHHTAPHIPFKQNREWNAVEAQLAGTIHCEYPPWVDFLCHDISVHIPHHLSTKIPSYNLRAAHASLEKNWDKHLNKAVFGAHLMSTIVTQCNLFDAEKKKWVKFDEIGTRI